MRIVAKIHNISQLEKLAAWGMLGKRPSAINLMLSEMRGIDLARWQSLLNRRLSDCGCAEGAVMLVIAASGYITYILFLQDEYSLFGWGVIGAGVAISCVAAALGKLAGLIRAQTQLVKLVRGLKTETF